MQSVTVSPSITAHIICKAHKMRQTTNNLWLLSLPSASHRSFHPCLPVAANYCVPAWDPEDKFSSHGDSWTVSISRRIFPTSRAGEVQLCWEISHWHLYLWQGGTFSKLRMMLWSPSWATAELVHGFHCCKASQWWEHPQAHPNKQKSSMILQKATACSLKSNSCRWITGCVCSTNR